MARDLKSSKKQQSRDNLLNKAMQDENIAKDIFNKADKNAVANTQETIKKYSGKSEKELKDELFAMKKANNLNDAQIEGFAKKVMPMLDAGKKKKLNDIIAMLKKQ